MKYYLFEEQGNGYGCNYTIGCGRRLRLLDGATSMEDAVRMATEFRTNKWGENLSLLIVDEDDERRIHKARILAVADVYEIDVPQLAAERKAIRQREEDEAKQQKELAELERLKTKYPNK